MVSILKKNFDFVITNVAGKEVLPLARFLKNRKHVSEFEIAEKIGTEINIARSMLYRLYHVNLVMSTRKRDDEKGWYIYYWSFRPEMIPKISKQIKSNKLIELKDKLYRETNGVYYMCGNNCVVLDFDQSLNFKFKCPECGLVMDQKRDCNDYVNSLKCKIQKLEKEII